MDALDIRGEAEWQRLKTHLEWSEGFLLGFVFSAHPRVVEIFRERLADLYRTRITRLQEWQIEHPEALQGFIPRLLHPTQREQALWEAPIWLDLSRIDQKGETRWRDARGQFLSRLNEQREPLRLRQNRPVVLILPASERSHAKALIPDLWAIRTFCLDTENWLGALPARPQVEGIPKRGAFPLSDYEQQLVAEWERRLSQYEQRTERGEIRTTKLLNAGFNAFNALYEKRQLQRAQQVAETCLQLAREAPEALRDLSVSLSNLAAAARAFGDIEPAQAALEEGLEIGQRLAAALPTHPDYSGLADYFRERLRELETGATRP